MMGSLTTCSTKGCSLRARHAGPCSTWMATSARKRGRQSNSSPYLWAGLNSVGRVASTLEADDDFYSGPAPVSDGWKLLLSWTSSTGRQVTVAGSMSRGVVQQDRRVDGGGQEVVGRGHRVEVPGQVEVEVLHRDDLAVAAAGGATA